MTAEADPALVDVTAYFDGPPGGLRDKACRAIFEAEPDVVSLGAGVDLTTGERDVQYLVPAHRALAVKAALTRAGFRLEPADQDEVGF